MNSEDVYIHQFTLVQFLKFLKDQGVFSLAIAAVLSDHINGILNCIIENIIMPVINRDSDKDGVEDIKKLEDWSLEVSGMKFKFGKLLISVLKFLFVAYILFLLFKMGQKVGKKIKI
jgi:large-conductance mechanosensitive channel